MRTRQLALALSSLAFVACLDLPVRSLSLPPASGAQTKVVFIQASGSKLIHVRASQFDEPLLAHAFPPARVTLLAIQEPISELPFEAGDLTNAPDGCPLLGELHGISAYRASVEADFNSDWVVEDPTSLDPVVRSFAVALDAGCAVDPCAQWSSQHLGLEPAEADVDWGVQVSEGLGLLGTKDGYVFAVEQDGSFRPVVVSPEGTPIRAGHRDDEGRIWLSRDNASFLADLRGDALELTATAGSLPGARLYASAGATSTTGEGLFVLGQNGVLARHNGLVWEVLSEELTPTPSGAIEKGGVAALGVDEAIAVTGFDSVIVRYRDGRAVASSSGLVIGFGAAAYVDSLGFVVGSVIEGVLYQYSESGLQPLQGGALAGDVRTIIPFESGFLAAGDLGSSIQYVGGQEPGFCELQQLASSTIEVLIPLTEDVMLVGTHRTETREQPPEAVVLQRLRE